MADNLTLDRNAMKDRSTSHLRIYVGGIPDQTTADNLYDHFIEFGQINGIVVNRNFAFVQFENESSALSAISKAAGSLLLGRTISVKTAQTNTDRKPTEVVTIHPEIPPAVALTDNIPVEDDAGDDMYDSFGNFVGDQGYRDEEEGYERSVRGRGRGGRARGVRGGRGRGGFRERSPIGRGDWPERGGYDRYKKPLDYPRPIPVTERNDCEIIVVAKSSTEYAEYIEGRLKHLGVVVDLLFPMEDVPIGKVLANIASRGCLYAILVMPQNHEKRSITLTILHGLPQEHRNIPLEDALLLISRNFQEVKRGGPSGREAIYALLGQLADGRTLTVLQYEKVIEYLLEKKEQQIKIELGEPAANKTEVELQQRILSILNDKKIESPPTAPPPPPQNKLLNDPTVRKALDSILQKFT